MKHIISNQFCLDLLSKINIKRAKALANVVMALSSEVGATSPTALSLSIFWHYHYSILSKVHADISSCSTFDDQVLAMLVQWELNKSHTNLLSLLANHKDKKC